MKENYGDLRVNFISLGIAKSFVKLMEELGYSNLHIDIVIGDPD
jgi:hypothetical protein